MRIEIQSPDSIKSSEQLHLRAILFNDSYEPVAVSRNAFIGPNLRAVTQSGFPFPESVEPSFGAADEPLTLQPFTFYGREREFSGLPPGEVEVTAYYQETEHQAKIAASVPLRIQPD
jgi:hypothetical protein